MIILGSSYCNGNPFEQYPHQASLVLTSSVTYVTVGSARLGLAVGTIPRITGRLGQRVAEAYLFLPVRSKILFL